MPELGPDTEVRFVKGVGERRAKALAEAGIRRVSDLLLRLPYRYEDRSAGRPAREVRDGESASVEVVVESLRVRPTRRRNLKIVELRARDDTGPVRATWFNRQHLKQVLRPGRRLVLFGAAKVAYPGAPPEFQNPKYELVTGPPPPRFESSSGDEPPGPETAGPDATDSGPTDSGPDPLHVGRIVPVYERLGEIHPRQFRRILHDLVESGAGAEPGCLPEELITRLALPTREEALREVHFPEPDAELDTLAGRRSPGYRRLILEEFFSFALGLLLRRREDRTGRAGGGVFPVSDAVRDLFRRVVPFRLTGAQRDTLRTIAREFAGPLPMRRLLQGDVGSGKTIVAVVAALIVIDNGAQAALMAPTEVLAEQHYATIRRLLEPHRIRVALLTSGLSAADRRATLTAVASGWAQFVIGTHSLIQEGAEFRNLGFAVVDEQHRFGVEQRQLLVERGAGCDLLVMTATPIPRTLTMALHGDLDLSELTELPPGRQPIETIVRSFAELDSVHDAVREEVRRGRQAFYVCPFIEDSEAVDGSGVERRFAELAEGPFRGLRLDLVHGRVPAAQRDRVMTAFASGEVDVLVATTVIEVGVDIPNATVMVVENAERFGLAQLHQLRGRVGRGRFPSTAALVHGDELTESAKRRLEVLEETADGFRIAEEDLAIRGPGEFFGARQHGVPPFRVADLERDAEFLRQARREAQRFLDSGAEEREEGRRILGEVRAAWGDRFGLTKGG